MSAVLSPCGTYRYRLDRDLVGGSGQTTVIMINPATADAETDDHTIRKLLGFGKGQWARLTVGNLFAFRATDVRGLAHARDPIGPENDWHLEQVIAEADRLVFAWGPLAKLPGALRTRWQVAARMAARAGRQPLSIGPVATDGHPKHPLMLPYSHTLRPWRWP